MATNIDSEITSLEAELPVEDVEWEVSAELGDGAAIVKIIPRRIPSIRGGGGEYRFSCQDKTFELVQSHR
ncbi:hypothetical protein [Hyphomonas sp.]|uniref:hypothetical protein n=1 Tax=Hyphomonas sp. TaxID=87 RepID=UPI0025BF708F|nr:hypothetical protein [Hyphomonas sp.]